MATTLLPLPGIAGEIFEGCPAATLIVDGDARLLRVNGAARALLSRVGDSGPLLDRLAGEALRCVHASGAGGCGQQEPCRGCVLRRSVAHAVASGAVRRAVACLERGGAPGPSSLRLLVSASPVHDQGRTYAALTLEEGGSAPCEEDAGAARLHDALLSTTRQGVVHLDERGTILSVNPAAERILGEARADLVGATWASLASRLRGEDGSPLPAEATPPSVAVRTGRAQRGKLGLLVLRDGAVRWIDVAAAPISPGEGAAPSQVCAVIEDVTERRHLEEELRHQRDFTQSVADGATEAIFVVDDAGRVRFANRAAHELFELAPEDLRGRRLHEAIHHHHQDGRPYPASDCPLRAACIAGPGFRDREDVFLREDGSSVHVRCSGAPLEVAGVPVGSVLVARDVTTLRCAEQAARLSESFLAFALETAGIGAWDLDLVDHTAHRSRQHDRIFGYQELLPEWTYERFLEHVLPDDREPVDRAFRQAVAAGSDWSFECRVRRRDGEIRWIWAAGRHAFDGELQPRRMAGIVQDITAHKRTEAALRESEARLRSVLENSLDCIYRMDLRTNRYTYVSPAAERVFGFPRETLLTLDAEAVISMIHPADRERVQAALAHLEETGEAELEYRKVTSRGDYKWISNHVALTRDEAGRPLYRSGTLRDVDERKRAEEELRTSRERIRELAARQETIREEEKARIARELHDEMGQLLTALRLDVDALEEGLGAGPIDGPRAALLERAVDASELVAQTVNALQRVVSALRPAALDRLGLCPALREECRRFEERTGVRCLAVVPEQPESLGPELDTALFRIAQEALTNVARHAGASTATVVIRAGEGEVVLRVEDDGRGVDLSAVASRSLGIAGMRERAERLGGELSVAPGARGGTVVCARIPRGRRAASPPAQR